LLDWFEVDLGFLRERVFQAYFDGVERFHENSSDVLSDGARHDDASDIYLYILTPTLTQA